MKRSRRRFLAWLAAAAAGTAVGWRAVGARPSKARSPRGVRPSQSPVEEAVAYLRRVMDQFHAATWVYTDVFAAGNHFVARGRLSSSEETADAAPLMDETCTEDPHTGISCIKAVFHSRPEGGHWAGWEFMNGVLADRERKPRPNWGDHPEAGVDLRGATTLTFWARGAEGGEAIDFFCLGAGRHPETGAPEKPHPDSSAKRSNVIILTREWKQYTIDLRGADLSFVLTGFGWVVDADRNHLRDVTFYLDDIRFDKPRLGEARLLVSYETSRSSDAFDKVLRNVAFVYDSALALMAFVAAGDRDRARLIADAFIYMQEHDRQFDDGRLRTTAQAGDIVLPNGWTPYGKRGRFRTPGWMDRKAPSDKEEWFEDIYFQGVNTGNMAWVALALLAYHETVIGPGDSPYLRAVVRMGEWIEKNLRAGGEKGGYYAGFETEATEAPDKAPDKGTLPASEHNKKITYRAAEHALDLYAVFQRLAYLTGDPKWGERAAHARKLLESTWDKDSTDPGKFWTGTKPDSDEINQDNVPVDIQAWALLALREESKPYWKALDFAEKNHKVRQGYDFNMKDRDGVWFEGTAIMAAAYRYVGRQEKSEAILTFLRKSQTPSGAMNAADRKTLTTGFTLSNGQPWLYYGRPHVGATAWYILAERGVNPFWMGSQVPRKGK